MKEKDKTAANTGFCVSTADTTQPSTSVHWSAVVRAQRNAAGHQRLFVSLALYSTSVPWLTDYVRRAEHKALFVVRHKFDHPFYQSMTRHFFITVFFAAFFSCSFGQSLNNKVYQKFITADSVIIVSHLTTYIPIVDDKTNERIGSYRLVEKNKVNYKIIKEHYQLDKKEIDSIVAIIITPNNDSIIQDISCFMPHHGILIFKKGKCSYFDICFGCRHLLHQRT